MVVGVGNYGVRKKEFSDTNEMVTTTWGYVDVAYVEPEPTIEGKAFAFEP